MTEDEMREFWDSLPMEIGKIELTDEEKEKISCLLRKSQPETMPVEEWNIPKEFLEFAGEAFDQMVLKKDPQQIDHPSWYNGETECIDAMIQTQGMEAVKAFCLCNAFKYLWRHRDKGGDEDIEKAVWYLEKYLELGHE